jgi:hypothetical protein
MFFLLKVVVVFVVVVVVFLFVLANELVSCLDESINIV